MNLSAVIITFNEEHNIARCLQSLNGVADEILVVDSYSTDRTEEIAISMGARFIQHPFEGHIEQKNYAMSQANYDHILSLDADEELSDELRSSIQAVKQGQELKAHRFNRLTNYCGKWIRHCGWYPDRKLRLWNRNNGRWGGENPHDKVILDQNMEVTLLEGDLLHYAFNSVKEHIDQIQYFTDISSRSAYKLGKRTTRIGVVLRSAFKFFRDYILKGGFLDGYYGFVICKNSAYAKYLKYDKLYRLNKGISSDSIDRNS